MFEPDCLSGHCNSKVNKKKKKKKEKTIIALSCGVITFNLVMTLL